MLAAALRRASAPGRCAAAAAVRVRGYAAPPSAAAPVFNFTDLFAPAAPKDTAYRKLTGDGVSTLDAGGKRILQARLRGCSARQATCTAADCPRAQVSPEALRLLAGEAMTDIAHLLRPGHLQQLANILKDPEARVHETCSTSPAADAAACAFCVLPRRRRRMTAS
jgi:fumarate hydratase class I